MKIGPACDIDVSEFRRNILLYGEPGVGKTVLTASSTNPLIIQTDPNGTISLNNHHHLRNVTVARPANMLEVDNLVKQICQGQHKQFETIVLDTVSSLRMFHVMGLEASLSRQMSQNEWTDNNKFVRTIMARLLTMSKRHVIVVAHQSEEKNTAGEIVAIRPDLPNELLKSAHRLFDGIYYYSRDGVSAGKVNRTLRLNADTGAIQTKSRIQLKNTYSNPESWKVIEDDVNKWLISLAESKLNDAN